MDACRRPPGVGPPRRGLPRWLHGQGLHLDVPATRSRARWMLSTGGQAARSKWVAWLQRRSSPRVVYVALQLRAMQDANLLSRFTFDREHEPGGARPCRFGSDSASQTSRCGVRPVGGVGIELPIIEHVLLLGAVQVPINHQMPQWSTHPHRSSCCSCCCWFCRDWSTAALVYPNCGSRES